MTTAQKEPSLVQKDLLAQKLVEPDFHLQEAEEPCDLARIQLCDAAGPRPYGPDRSDLRPRLDEPDRSDFEPRPEGPDRL